MLLRCSSRPGGFHEGLKEAEIDAHLLHPGLGPRCQPHHADPMSRPSRAFSHSRVLAFLTPGSPTSTASCPDMITRYCCSGPRTGPKTFKCSRMRNDGAAQWRRNDSAMTSSPSPSDATRLVLGQPRDKPRGATFPLVKHALSAIYQSWNPIWDNPTRKTLPALTVPRTPTGAEKDENTKSKTSSILATFLKTSLVTCIGRPSTPRQVKADPHTMSRAHLIAI